MSGEMVSSLLVVVPQWYDRYHTNRFSLSHSWYILLPQLNCNGNSRTKLVGPIVLPATSLQDEYNGTQQR